MRTSSGCLFGGGYTEGSICPLSSADNLSPAARSRTSITAGSAGYARRRLQCSASRAVMPFAAYLEDPEPVARLGYVLARINECSPAFGSERIPSEVAIE